MKTVPMITVLMITVPMETVPLNYVYSDVRIFNTRTAVDCWNRSFIELCKVLRETTNFDQNRALLCSAIM